MTKYEKLRQHRVPLTAAERAEVLTRKAVWRGPAGEETPAVWKSVSPKTKKTTYVTNTHRAYNTADTLRGP